MRLALALLLLSIVLTHAYEFRRRFGRRGGGQYVVEQAFQHRSVASMVADELQVLNEGLGTALQRSLAERSQSSGADEAGDVVESVVALLNKAESSGTRELSLLNGRAGPETVQQMKATVEILQRIVRLCVTRLNSLPASAASSQPPPSPPSSTSPPSRGKPARPAPPDPHVLISRVVAHIQLLQAQCMQIEASEFQRLHGGSPSPEALARAPHHVRLTATEIVQLLHRRARDLHAVVPKALPGSTEHT
jgi:hypothetical protein